MDGAETLESLIEILCEIVQRKAKSRALLLSRVLNLKKQCASAAAHPSITAQLVDLITSVERVGVAGSNEARAHESVLITGINSWLAKLYAPQTQHLCPLDASQLERVLQWLHTQSLPPCAKDATACAALAAITVLISAHPTQAGVYWERLHHLPYKQLLRCLGAECGCDKNDEFTVEAAQCLDSAFGCILETATSPTSASLLNEVQSQVCTVVADAMLFLLYVDGRPPCQDPAALYNFLLAALSLLHTTAACCPTYAQEHVSELLGLARAYMTSGITLDEAPFPLPQRVAASQQSLYDSAEEIELPEGAQARRINGGKVSKTRKPRANAKAQTTPPRFALDANIHTLIKTSDSDVSEAESALAAARSAPQHQRRTKLRISAFLLVGAVTRSLPRRQLFGYWHALFAAAPESSVDDGSNRVDLLFCAQHDPYTRCRSAALQVASQLLLGSKGFLSQAECADGGVGGRPSAFMPFAQSLGQMVLAMYESLTVILASEASMPVLTHALKCLAVLVQATPFPRLQPAVGPYVRRFAQQVRRLVHHRDCTIQVSALMVMEFLVSAPELTPEISQAVGLPRAINAKSTVNDNRLVDEAAAELIPAAGAEEEYLASDEEEESECEAGSMQPTEPAASSSKTLTPVPSPSLSWLLLRVLHNLDSEQQQTLPKQHRSPTSVRIESLQVLAAMAAHFPLLRGHLPSVALALHQALQDALPDVRLYAARTLDTCAYQIGRHLLETKSTDQSELTACDTFWAVLMPLAMARIGVSGNGAPEELPAFKVCLCDALSNIGVVQFERLSQPTQMQLFNLLSGLSSESDEEMGVRAAAVRALAVFVMFPSLRGNLVFVENAAELALRLADDPNLLVRVKALWSMGNISDALITNCCAGAATGTAADSQCERISTDLLRRLIIAATAACSDNDKVRSNAVRTLGNLLRLLGAEHYADDACRGLFQRAIAKLIDCVLRAGNAKVKWNSCYAIGQLLRSSALYEATERYPADMAAWQPALYPALCHVIVAHANFKVRANATVAISHIAERAHFGAHFEALFIALLAAIEQSYQLDNFYEYNHRDNLQEQLCLTVCHVVGCAVGDDFPVLRKHLAARLEVVRSTWARVTNRMVPERAAPLLSCSALLQARLRDQQTELPVEQRAAAAFIAQALLIE